MLYTISFTSQISVSNYGDCGHLGNAIHTHHDVNSTFGMYSAQPAKPRPASLRQVCAKHKADLKTHQDLPIVHRTNSSLLIRSRPLSASSFISHLSFSLTCEPLSHLKALIHSSLSYVLPISALVIYLKYFCVGCWWPGISHSHCIPSMQHRVE